MLLLIVVAEVETHSAESQTELSAADRGAFVVADVRTLLRGVFAPKAGVIYRRGKVDDNGRRSTESTAAGRLEHRHRDFFLRCQQAFDTSDNPRFLV